MKKSFFTTTTTTTTIGSLKRQRKLNSCLPTVSSSFSFNLQKRKSKSPKNDASELVFWKHYWQLVRSVVHRNQFVASFNQCATLPLKLFLHQCLFCNTSFYFLFLYTYIPRQNFEAEQFFIEQSTVVSEVLFAIFYRKISTSLPFLTNTIHSLAK